MSQKIFEINLFTCNRGLEIKRHEQELFNFIKDGEITVWFNHARNHNKIYCEELEFSRSKFKENFISQEFANAFNSYINSEKFLYKNDALLGFNLELLDPGFTSCTIFKPSKEQLNRYVYYYLSNLKTHDPYSEDLFDIRNIINIYDVIADFYIDIDCHTADSGEYFEKYYLGEYVSKDYVDDDE